ncbi:MAG TPA: hypothetical protein DDZ83_00095 [Nitrospinae bacterium]|nr:hypothetical protein [Nitrospinota bacterium]
MHDGVYLEQLGVPTAVIVTETFLHEAHVQRAALGMDGIDPVIVLHPLSTLTEDEIGGRAAAAAPQVKKILLGG